jgi:hypothetical protein
VPFDEVQDGTSLGVGEHGVELEALLEGALIDAQDPGRIGIDVEQLGCGVGLEGLLDAIGRDLLRDRHIGERLVAGALE